MEEQIMSKDYGGVKFFLITLLIGVILSTAFLIVIEREIKEKIALNDLINDTTQQEYQSFCNGSKFYNSEIDEFVKIATIGIIDTSSQLVQIDCLFATTHQNSSGVSSQIATTMTVVVYYEFKLSLFGKGESEISWLE